MKIAGIIPARYASSRLPGKPLIFINGKTMIERVYEQTLKSKLINEVIVATDDIRIFDCVKNFGGEVMMTSPRHHSGTDRICEVGKKIKCDIVVNVQGDEPFIDPGNIDKAIMPLIDDRKVNVSTLACKFTDAIGLIDVNKVKVVFDKNNFALYFSRNVIPYCVNNLIVTSFNYYKHIGLYVYRKSFLIKFSGMKKSRLESAEKLEQLRILENGEKIKIVITKKDSFSIDTEDDFRRSVNL